MDDVKVHCWFPARALCLMVLLASLTAGTMPAQTVGLAKHADTVFAHLGKREGLPNSAVATIVQDADGFLWFGSGSGVSRWDGYHFKSYVMKVGVPDGLPDTDIWTMYVDPQKRLWIGTATRGLVLYDPVHDNFRTFRPQGEASYKTIHAISTDGKKGLWVLSQKGLDHFDPDTGVFAHVDMPGIGPKQNMYDLCRDAQGRIVLATIKGLYRGDAEGKQFAAWDVFDGVPPRVIGLFLDDGGRLWIGTPRGVYLVPAGGDKATLVRENGEDGKPVAGNPLAGQGVQAFTQAAPGVVWVGTVGNGILEVDTKTFAMRRIMHDPEFDTSLLDDSVIVFFRDREGTLWTGTQNGISHKLSGTNGIETIFRDPTGINGKAVASTRLLQDEVNAILPRRDGSVVLGLGMKGFEILDAAGRRTAQVQPHEMQKSSPLPMGIMHGLAEAPDGTLYLGTAAGVYRADHDGSHVALLAGQTTPLPLVYQLVYDTGTLWIATETGVWKQDVSGKVAGAAVRVPVPSVTSQAIVRSGSDLWVGTTADLYRYDIKTGSVEQIPLGPQDGTGAAILCLALDRQQRLWIATNGAGVMVMTGRDAKGHATFETVKGLPNGNVDIIVAGADGRMWAGTDDGIARIDPKTLEMQHLGEADGAQISGYYSNSGAAMADGSLLFGGVGGMSLIEPSRVRPWTYVPPVAVTEVTLGGERVPSGAFNQQDGGPIFVPANKNSLEVEFTALDYTAPELNQYEYRLVGFHGDWVTTDATRRTASYTNLPPGEYTLELRGSNRNGVWGATRQVGLRVLPSWSQTLTAKVVAVLLVLLGMAMIVLMATAYLRQRQRVLERRVAQRTEELQAMTQELEESHRQLEKIAYTDSLTGLANRRMFADFFRRLLSRKQREGGGFVLIVLDLDKFKEINDTHGHDAGDAWLRLVAQRLSPMVRESDCFARQGGDEFGMLLAERLNDEAIAALCEKIAASFAEPVVVEGVTLVTAVSVGVSVYPEDGAGQEELLKSADMALYEVKRKGGNGWKRAASANV